MLKRIITSIVALAIFLPILIFSDTWVFPIVMSLCVVVGIFEMLSCIGIKNNFFIAVPSYIVGAFFPSFIRYCSINNRMDDFFKFALCVACVFIVYILGVAVFCNKKLKVTDAGLAFTACLYVAAAFTSIVYLRDMAIFGKYIYLLVFLCAWMTDIFAYFTGRLLGKHKLIPEVSPKKTVEGAIGGIIFCVITTVVFGLVVSNILMSNSTPNLLVIAISGAILSVVSQIGDLTMSLIKRNYNVKDFGKMFPGHGGLLDRFDSVMAVSVTLVLICTYFNMFNV